MRFERDDGRLEAVLRRPSVEDVDVGEVFRDVRAVVGLGSAGKIRARRGDGTPARRTSSRARPSGMRTATVSRPAVTEEGREDFFESKRVSGPGQNLDASFVARAGIRLATLLSIFKSLT